MNSASPEDNRVPCKYGSSCYQKNPVHHEKYKHPKKRNSEEVVATTSSTTDDATKKQKKEPSESLQGSSELVKVSSNFAEGSKTTINVDDLIIPEDYKEEIIINDLPSDVRERIKKVFLLPMPEDFYSFFSFCESISKNAPELALQTVGLVLVGPYDLLSGKIKKCTRAQAAVHYRYYYDPPEFQTVLKGYDKTGFHLGYFRDEPNELPLCIASNEAEKGCDIKFEAVNIFAAVSFYLDKFLNNANPFMRMKLQALQNCLQSWARRNNFLLNVSSPQLRARKAKIVSKTFHGAGIVVPFDNLTELGYRDLAENDKSLKIILKSIVDDIAMKRKPDWSRLQTVITFANIANDECDFGTSLELGIDLFCFGNDMFNQSALQLMKTSYNLLGRSQFANIAEIHLMNRKKGFDVSSIEY